MPDPVVDVIDTSTPPASPPSDPFADLVGDGKKYKDAQALAKSRLEADAFIEQLKKENAELRTLAGKKDDEANQSKSIEALIEQIQKATSGQNGNQPTTLSREDIEKLVKDGINSDRTEVNRKANRANVNAKLVNGFGGDTAKAGDHLKTRMQSLGMTGEAVKELAETNPKVFEELFVPQPKAPKQGDSLPPGRTVQLDNANGERGASYYRNLRKQLGSKYFAPDIQNARMKDALRLGEKFNTL
jgi:hypothetical protein